MKCIVFDMDGVLFDSCAIAEESIAQQYPDITKEQQKEILAGNFHEELAKLSLVKKSETAEEKEIRQMQYAYNKSQSLMYEGMREMLFDLHSLGHKIALNTSAWDRNCLPLMEQAQILHLFDFMGTAEISKSKVEKKKELVILLKPTVVDTGVWQQQIGQSQSLVQDWAQQR